MISNAQFARLAAYMGAACSGWAADCLITHDGLDEPCPQHAFNRFVADMERRLQRMKDLAAADDARRSEVA
jgi:hypothetical protein